MKKKNIESSRAIESHDILCISPPHLIPSYHLSCALHCLTLSLFASTCKLKVEIICPIASQFLLCLVCLASVFGRTGNSGDYAGSISVSQHSRHWQHDVRSCLDTISKAVENHSLRPANRESVEKGGAFLNRHNKNKQAERQWKASGYCSDVVFSQQSLCKYFTKNVCVTLFQWDLQESCLMALLR